MIILISLRASDDPLTGPAIAGLVAFILRIVWHRT
jgi:hypothetical protein